jgi:hypothetical protein
MPWTTTPTTEQRQKFVTLANSGRFTVTELCLEFGVSRKCGTLKEVPPRCQTEVVHRTQCRYAPARPLSASW